MFIYVLMAVVVVASLLVSIWLAKLEQASRNNLELDAAENFAKASEVVEALAKFAVGKLEQLHGKDLREQIKMGKANKEELYELSNEAFREIMLVLSEDNHNALQVQTKDVTQYIYNVIETEVIKLKNQLYGAK